MRSIAGRPANGNECSGCATKMLDNYFPILVFVLVGLAFGCAPILLGWLVAPNRPDSEKLSAFECGFAPFEDARMKFDVRYYLIAIPVSYTHLDVYKRQRLDLVQGIKHYPFLGAGHFVALEVGLGVRVRVVTQYFKLDKALFHLWSPE